MSFLTCFSMVLWTMSLFRLRRRRLRDFSCIPWFPPAFGRRTRPLPVNLNRFAAALFVFIFGMTASPISPLRCGLRAGSADGWGQKDAKGTRVMVEGGRIVKEGGGERG